MQNLKFKNLKQKLRQRHPQGTFTELWLVFDLGVLGALSSSWVVTALLLLEAEVEKGGYSLSSAGNFLHPNQPVCIAGARQGEIWISYPLP